MPACLTRLVAATVAVAGFLTHAPRAAADYILDDFNSPSPGQMYQITLLSNGQTSYTYPGSGATPVSPTVSRIVTVSVTEPADPAFNAASGTIGGGAFTLATDDKAEVTAALSYALTGASGDLTGATGLGLGFVALDPGLNPDGSVAAAAPVTVTLTDASNRTTSLTTAVAGSGNPFTASFDFGSFAGDSAFDFSRVSSVSLILNGGSGSQRGIDFTLDNVHVKTSNPVPAPPAVLLAGVGALALIGRARLIRSQS